MQRKWYVWPHPQTGAVERQDLVNALADAAAVLDRIGGVLAVVQERVPSGAPGEMVSAVVVIEWKDRTDAKPQLEQPTQVVAPPEPEPAPEPDGEDDQQTEGALIYGAGPDGVVTASVVAAPGDPIGDGLDESTLEEEDVSSVPETVR